ncbi:hypothetical protein PTKIN_Ptkin13bG0023500 [Pterospermum kingtungense]
MKCDYLECGQALLTAGLNWPQNSREYHMNMLKRTYSTRVLCFSSIILFIKKFRFLFIMET